MNQRFELVALPGGCRRDLWGANGETGLWVGFFICSRINECWKEAEIKRSKITGIRAGFAVNFTNSVLNNKPQNT
jgi:hypothetical protein